MTARIAINGFGRIGRLVARALFETGRKDLELVAVNDPGPNTINLIKYDSVHGKFPFEVKYDSDEDIDIEGQKIHLFGNRNPENIKWADYGVDIVLECTGVFRDSESASKHLDAGAKKVLISAPGKNVEKTIVYGVNHDKLESGDTIVSNASCTTNCLAPVAYALNEKIGIERGFMTTIHAYTGDQKTVDGSHSDPYRGRAAALNMIPTSTGAAKAVGLVMPELNGKLDGVAVRVPTPNVSLVDLKFVPKNSASVDDINAAVTEFARGPLKGVLDVYEEPLVSSDFNHNPHSSIFSLEGTRVIDDNLVRVMAWYDNEWGFSCRMLDTAKAMHDAGYSK